MAVLRFMKNIDTGSIFPWGEQQVKKLNMFECDKEGNLKVEHQSVATGDMMKTMEALVDEKAALKKKVVAQEKTINAYIGAYGPLDSKLPEVSKRKEAAPAAAAPKPEPASEAPVEKAEPAVSEAVTGGPETTPEPAPRLTKASIAEALKEENGIEVNPKDYKLDELIKMKDNADTASPDEMAKTEDLLK